MTTLSEGCRGGPAVAALILQQQEERPPYKFRAATAGPPLHRLTTLLSIIVTLSSLLFAQGVRMSADFLPLEVGNRWIYTVLNERGEKIGEFDVHVQDRTILEGRSFYVFNQFPFTPGFDGSRTTLIRYDRAGNQYVRMESGDEMALFEAGGASTEVLDTAQSGLPAKFRLDFEGLALTFERSVGIVEAKIQSERGVQTAQLVGARVGERRIGKGVPERVTREEKVKQQVENVTTITEKNPSIQVQGQPSAEGHKFTLTVKNTSDKLLAFDFNSGQSFDFVVTDPVTGREIWRWSRRMFFTAVIRSEAIRPKGQWKFEATWNHRDNDLNLIQPGQYRLVGILTASTPLESDPVVVEVK